MTSRGHVTTEDFLLSKCLLDFLGDAVSCAIPVDLDSALEDDPLTKRQVFASMDYDLMKSLIVVCKINVVQNEILMGHKRAVREAEGRAATAERNLETVKS